MISITYANVKDLNLLKKYHNVSKARQSKIDKYKFEKDKKLSCGVELLLLKALKEIEIENPIFEIDKNNKPFIANYPNIHFNLSHSGDYVVCGISDEPIGVDIEYNDPEIDLDIANNFFYNKEYESIINCENPSDEFFKYWVLKESYMKYTGLGFKLELDSFEIELNEENINLKVKNKEIEDIEFSLFNIPNYKIAIASKYKVEQITEVEL